MQLCRRLYTFIGIKILASYQVRCYGLRGYWYTYHGRYNRECLERGIWQLCIKKRYPHPVAVRGNAVYYSTRLCTGIEVFAARYSHAYVSESLKSSASVVFRRVIHMDTRAPAPPPMPALVTKRARFPAQTNIIFATPLSQNILNPNADDCVKTCKTLIFMQT